MAVLSDPAVSDVSGGGGAAGSASRVAPGVPVGGLQEFLYQLGVGKVVFKDWESLWDSCQNQWATLGGIPGFGDWSPLLDEIDPFRDGRAAERMGDYIKWLLDGFRAGLDRNTVMADAAERYCALWGQDKITQVNVRLAQRPAATGRLA